MVKDLESPFENGAARWDLLYRSRGEDVSESRPVFTGDVYSNILLPGSTGTVKKRLVAVIQHPCAMRVDGVNLIYQLLAAEVVQRNEISEEQWTSGMFNLMPLPDLRPELTNRNRHQAIDFGRLHLLRPEVLNEEFKIAALSQRGVNLLLQRWVNFSSRVVVQTHHFQEQTEPQFEEADLIEEWCDERASGDVSADAAECVAWLREERDGQTYQQMLSDPQMRSVVRKAARTHLRRAV